MACRSSLGRPLAQLGARTLGRADPPHRVRAALPVDAVRVRAATLELLDERRLPRHPLLLHQLAHDGLDRFRRGDLDLVRGVRFVLAENCRKNCPPIRLIDLTFCARRSTLTHGLQLADQLLLGPLLLVTPQGQVRRDDGHFVVVRVGHVQVVHQHNVRVLEQPVAAPVERRQDRRVDVTAVDALGETIGVTWGLW